MLNIDEPSLLIRIAKLYKASMTAQQIYEATRGVWRLSPDKDAAKFALSIAGGIVKEVYSIGAWHAAGSTPNSTRPIDQVSVLGRWEFVGKIAAQSIRDKYIDKSVAHYFTQGNASPVIYANIKRN